MEPTIASDATILAERVGQLEAEKEQLQKENKDLTAKLEKAQKNVYWYKGERYLVTAGHWLVASVILAFLAVLAFRAISVPHTVDHCYIGPRPNDDKIHLWGNVEWGADEDMGVFQSAQDAAKAAQNLSCPLFRR